MTTTNKLISVAFAFALLSIVFTRVFRMFSVAEVLAVLAFLAGLGILLVNRRQVPKATLNWPEKLFVVGSCVGLGGVVIKLAFVALGIGTGAHDMSDHDAAPNPLLQHIHHLFFNIGFLLFLISAVTMLVGRVSGKKA